MNCPTCGIKWRPGKADVLSCYLHEHEVPTGINDKDVAYLLSKGVSFRLISEFLIIDLLREGYMTAEFCGEKVILTLTEKGKEYYGEYDRKLKEAKRNRL